MLVLTRKLKQEVRIGDTINLRVLQIRGKRVKIGISCPQQLKVLRGELCNAVTLDSQPAGNESPDGNVTIQSVTVQARGDTI